MKDGRDRHWVALNSLSVVMLLDWTGLFLDWEERSGERWVVDGDAEATGVCFL